MKKVLLIDPMTMPGNSSDLIEPDGYLLQASLLSQFLIVGII